MNVWCFDGNLGQDCEVRFTSDSTPIVTFSVASKKGYGDKAITTWVKCEYWGKRAEGVSQYLTKGTRVGISGEAWEDPWQDQNGNERTTLKVRVNSLDLLSPRSDSGQQHSGQSHGGGGGYGGTGELPF